jgi:hypothetical protein
MWVKDSGRISPTAEHQINCTEISTTMTSSPLAIRQVSVSCPNERKSTSLTCKKYAELNLSKRKITLHIGNGTDTPPFDNDRSMIVAECLVKWMGENSVSPANTATLFVMEDAGISDAAHQGLRMASKVFEERKVISGFADSILKKDLPSSLRQEKANRFAQRIIQLAARGVETGVDVKAKAFSGLENLYANWKQEGLQQQADAKHDFNRILQFIVQSGYVSPSRMLSISGGNFQNDLVTDETRSIVNFQL